MISKNLCVLVLWTKVASELEGLRKGREERSDRLLMCVYLDVD